jgi:hypothetical protein
MKTLKFASCLVALLAAAALQAQDLPKPGTPEKEHAWLKQLVGEWDTDSECILEPGKAALKCQGTESVRAIGEFWTLGETRSTILDASMVGVMTLGYDAKKKKYVGTWVDSMMNHLWKYEGTVDAAGKILTLEAEGPNPMSPGKISKYRDAIEIKNPDHKVMTSSVLGDDGTWTTFMTSNYRRKK